jgi:hypothetical protein
LLVATDAESPVEDEHESSSLRALFGMSAILSLAMVTASSCGKNGITAEGMGYASTDASAAMPVLSAIA